MSEVLLLYRIVLAILRFLFLHMKLNIVLSRSLKHFGDFDGHYIDSVDCFW